MQTVTLSLDLVNGIMAYMGSRPFSEVYQLINQIQAQAQPQVAAMEPEPEQPVTE